MSFTLWFVLSVVFTGISWWFIFREERKTMTKNRHKGMAIVAMSVAAFISIIIGALMSLHYMIPVVLGSVAAVAYGLYRLMSWLYDRYIV